MTEITKYIEVASSGQSLTIEQAERAFQIMVMGGATPAQIAAILVALKVKGETVDEIYAAAHVLRSKMLPVEVSEEIRQNSIDCCGTGGDKKGTLNISTAVAFVLAAAELNVAKHGNKAISSNSGSADVLRALGIDVDIESQHAAECLEKVGIAFLFAPLFHKSLVNIGSTRKELGIRTIFNILGPLCNPATPPCQLIGVYSKGLVPQIASVAKNFGLKSAIIVNGEDGLDEISVCAQTYAAELNENGEITEYNINPTDYGVKIYDEEELKGGDATYNSQQMLKLFKGEQSAYRDAVILNSAFALKIAGKIKNIEDGLQLASNLIDSGKASDKLKTLVEITNSF